MWEGKNETSMPVLELKNINISNLIYFDWNTLPLSELYDEK